MKRLILAFAAGAALVCAAAYQQPAGMKTSWGKQVTPENAWREYPRPQMVRANWTNLNGLWQYAISRTDLLTKDSPMFPTQWAGEILVPFVIESALSGVGRPLESTETLWYRRTFDAAPKAGERLLLHFEQADFRAMVFVNGVEVGVPHEGGQMPFSYDVTDFVKSGTNELVVAIWDPTTDFIGSTGKQIHSKKKIRTNTRSSGIGGTVWLETVPKTHLVDYKVTTDIDAGTVSVTLNGAGNLSKATGTVKVLKGGRTLAQGEMGEWGCPITIKLPQPIALWSPETPNLYDLEITFADGAAGTQDVVKGYFGMRAFELKADAKGVLRFYLNHQPRFIIATLDQGWWPDGLLTPPSEAAMAFDINALKKMGYDAMRKHVKVEPRRYYALCDKLGMIVLQDMPHGRGDRVQRYGFFRSELKEMMDCLQAVPSIVMWIPYNEGWGQPARFLTHSTLAWVQRYDPTRLVDGPSGANDWEGGTLWFPKGGRTQHLPEGVEEVAHAVDRHDYGKHPTMFEVNPRRASFLGEFGGIGCRIEDHLWCAEAWGYNGTGNLSRSEAEARFLTLMDSIALLAERGLAGCVYTETADFEAEINGLVTYDREVFKFDVAAVAAVHARVRHAAARAAGAFKVETLAARLDANPRAWAYTFEQPSAGWEKPDFNDTAWKRAAGGFGNKTIERDFPYATVNTRWETPSIWLRRHFVYTPGAQKPSRVSLDLFHDEDVEVYLNGKLLFTRKGNNCTWASHAIDTDLFLKNVKPGDNVIAVHLIQTIGGQYFDLGLTLDFAN